MADRILCPVCGEPNPADMEFCRNCQSRLQPLTGSLKGENAPIQPGEPPTKKVTSELEPLLPQWLREARQQARESTSENKSQPEKQAPSTPPASDSDLLAGLRSQSQDEEEIPEWLARITGATSTKKAVPEENQVKWVELGHEAESQGTSSHDEHQDAAAGPSSDDLTDWFKQAAASSENTDFRLPKTPPQDFPPIPSTGDVVGNEPAASRDAQDLGWLKNLDAAASALPEPPDEDIQPPREDVPDWLQRLQAEQHSAEQATPAPQQPASPLYEGDVPDWLRRFGEEAPAAAVPEPEPAEQETIFPDQPLPDWLKVEDSPPAKAEPSKPEAVSEEPAIPAELPDWISALGKPEEESSTRVETTEPEVVPEEAAFPAELPDWISSIGKPDEAALPEAASAQPEPTFQEPAPSPELPGWLTSLHNQQEGSEPGQPGTPAFEADQPESPASAVAAFSGDALSGDDVDAIFSSMQTPAWLSGVTPSEPAAETNAPAASQPEEPIGPAELPSWVKAMRPVESALTDTANAGQEPPTEERGPLAGLHGVLPAIPGAVLPSSRPSSHAIKLDATEQQQAHAALLEQILAAETFPVPMKSGMALRSQPVVRWVLSAVIILILAGAVFSGTQIFPLPTTITNDETGLALKAVAEVPPDAPVLLIFDYQPATVGEMEATGSSLVENLLLLKHPRLALLSTSPTGAALAERFMSTALPDLPQRYQRDTQYVNLGYLPGGLAGVYNFARNPSTTVPLDANSAPVWQSAVLSRVTHLSDFALIIVLTDSVESGRTWIEQTSLSRGNGLMIMAASAQAGPMLLPYFDAGQVNGLISGVYGAVGAEQANAGKPGLIRRYWDAYSIGLYLAVALITLGGLANFLLGIRDRRGQAVE